MSTAVTATTSDPLEAHRERIARAVNRATPALTRAADKLARHIDPAIRQAAALTAQQIEIQRAQHALGRALECLAGHLTPARYDELAAKIEAAANVAALVDTNAELTAALTAARAAAGAVREAVDEVDDCDACRAASEWLDRLWPRSRLSEPSPLVASAGPARVVGRCVDPRRGPAPTRAGPPLAGKALRSSVRSAAIQSTELGAA